MMENDTSEFRGLGPADELPDGFVNPYYLEDLKQRIAVARAGGSIYAFDDLCPCTPGEKSCTLSAGSLAGTTITCQCHGSQFDLATGSVIRGPATVAPAGYDAREAEGQIQARV